MKFDPIDPEGLTDRELMEALAAGQNATHNCVHQLEAKVDRRERDSTARHNELKGAVGLISDAVGGLRKDVGGLESAVSTLQDSQKQDSATIDALRVRMGVGLDPQGNIKAVKPAVGAWPMWKIATTFFGALSGIVLFVQLMLPAVVAGAVAFYRALMAAH